MLKQSDAYNDLKMSDVRLLNFLRCSVHAHKSCTYMMLQVCTNVAIIGCT